MSNTVKTKKLRLKEYQIIDLEKKDPRLLSVIDSKINAGKSIQIDKNTLEEYTKSLSSSGNKQTGLHAHAYVVGSSRPKTQFEYKSQLPFELIKEETGVDFSSTQAGMSIINNHLDDEGMQGPFVKEHVGGFLHRRNKFNDISKRIEAYLIKENSDGLIITKPPASPINFRRAAGSPCYNVGNRKASNYNKEYEIVMTSGRESSNKHLILNGESFLSEVPVVSSHTPGVVDFNVPERVKTSHVIVNRFSAPGAPETAAPFSRDRAGDEYSIYNTVNYRNKTARDTLDVLSATPSKKFGIRDGSVDAGAYHKVPRNTRRFIGSSGNETKQDNLFLNYSIPSNDYGYLWISKSAEDGVYDFLKKNSNFGHQHLGNNYSNVDSHSTIGFLSKSLADGAGSGPDNHRLTFSGLNFVTNNEITESENLTQYTSGNLNQQLTNANGPYGWPTWKQIRNCENPVVRKQRKSNNISIVFRDGDPNVSVHPGKIYDYGETEEHTAVVTSERTVVSFKEPAISDRFSPLRASMHFFEDVPPEGIVLTNEVPSLFPQSALEKLWEGDFPLHSVLRQGTTDNIVSDSTTVVLDASVQSSVSSFANEELSLKIKDKEGDFFQNENLQKINIFLGESERATQSNVIRELSYLETIYPKENMSYISTAIARPYFKFFGWDTNRASRSLISVGNSKYEEPLINTSTQKVFTTFSATEKEIDFVRNYFNSYEKVDLNASTTQANILSASFITSSTWVLDSRENFTTKPLNITASYFTEGENFLLNRSQGTRGEGILQNDYSIFPMGYNGLRGAPPFAPIYNRRIPQTYVGDVYLSGESLWEATGSSTMGPFYDNYQEFSKDLKYLSRGHSLVPEFTMSSIMEDIYASKDFDSASTPESFLQLTGTLFSTSGDEDSNQNFFKNFSNSEFMKYFVPLVENVENAGLGLRPGRLTLKCNANLKLLPYRGFFPAERAVQISEIFHRNYFHENSYLSKYIPNVAITENEAKNYLKLRIENAKSQASKPFFSPGVLFNSIKTGLAVDYPVFTSSIAPALLHITQNYVTSSITSHSPLGLGASTCFTGSLINNTVDTGIPRISGLVSRRVGIEDLLEPERLTEEIIYDNEPHPSASLLYGSAQWLRVLNRPTIFGKLDEVEVKEKNAIDFSITKESFANSMRPYKSAINNFTAETVKFFLKDEKVQTHVSDAVNPYLKSGVCYKMRVYVNNQDVTMYDRHSAFGPPVDDGDVQNTEYLVSQSFGAGVASTATLNFTGMTNSSINNSTVNISNYDGTQKTYKFVNGYTTNPTGATGTITFNLTGTDLDNSTVTLQSAKSVAKTYLFTTTSFYGSTGDLYKGAYVVVKVASSASANACASEFQTALASSNGHSGTITSSYNSSSGVLTVTQAITGKSGNVGILGSGKFSASSSRTTGFAGGTSGVKYSTGNLVSGQVIVQVESATTTILLASELKTAIDSFNGHNLTIKTATVTSAVLALKQSTLGALGNRTIAGTGQLTGSALTSFANGADAQGISFLTQSITTATDQHGFLPYIAPYLDPGSRPYAEISFTPSESKNYTIPNIIEDCSISYYNLSAPTSAQSSTNYLNSMSISASIDLKKYVALYSDNYNIQEDGTKSAKKEDKKYRWVIQPKWETPVLDFTDSKVSALNLSNNQVTHVTGSPWKTRYLNNYYESLSDNATPYLTASTGMWHQSGNILKEGDLKGYYLTIESGEEKISSSKGDLASELGFIDKALKTDNSSGAKPLSSKKLGRLAKEKTISESIVAIPYYLTEENKVQLFDINTTELAKARGYNSQIKDSFSYNLQQSQTKEELDEIENDYLDWFDSVGHDSVSSISYQLRMMQKYVLPPHFDFLKNEKINSHVMYFFQFKSTLDNNDLARIWQNLYPRSPAGPGNLKVSKIQKTQRKTDVQYITGFLDASILPEVLGAKSNYEDYELFLENNVRWLVFKVKYRANNDLTETRDSSIPRSVEDLESINGILTKQPLSTSITDSEDKKLFSRFSYNWPYDFFSLVENIKMESKVDFYSPITQTSAASPTATAQPLTSRIEQADSSVSEISDQAETQILVTEDSGATSPALSNLIIRQEVKSDATSAPSPANKFNIQLASGYQLKTNSESIYVNGVLQVAGSSMDYTISGTIITFTYNVKDDDSIYVTYIRE